MEVTLLTRNDAFFSKKRRRMRHACCAKVGGSNVCVWNVLLMRALRSVINVPILRFKHCRSIRITSTLMTLRPARIKRTFQTQALDPPTFAQTRLM